MQKPSYQTIHHTQTSLITDTNINSRHVTSLIDKSLIPTPTELCSNVLHTVYMGTQNSSQATKNRASLLAQTVGSFHTNLYFDTVIQALLTMVSSITNGKIPQFLSQGGSIAEDLALQNIQARLRMVIANLCAALFPWVRGRKGNSYYFTCIVSCERILLE
jgi:NAD+ synthase (glutamine-hydrolysing)